MFGAANLTQNVNPDEYSYSGYGIEFYSCYFFQFQIFIGVKIMLFLWNTIVHQCILILKKKYILVFGKGPTQGLEDITIIAEAEHYINFSRSQIKFCLSFHYNESNIFYLLMPQLYINSK